MKIYLKNRTQLAKLFLVDENYILGFLIGEYDGNKTIKKLNGEIISLFTLNKEINLINISKENIKEDESLYNCEVTNTETNYGHVKQYKYKDGRTVTIPNIRI